MHCSKKRYRGEKCCISYKLLVQVRLKKDVFIENIIIMERAFEVNFIFVPMQTEVTSTPLKIEYKTYLFHLFLRNLTTVNT